MWVSLFTWCSENWKIRRKFRHLMRWSTSLYLEVNTIQIFNRNSEFESPGNFFKAIIWLGTFLLIPLTQSVELKETFQIKTGYCEVWTVTVIPFLTVQLISVCSKCRDGEVSWWGPWRGQAASPVPHSVWALLKQDHPPAAHNWFLWHVRPPTQTRAFILPVMDGNSQCLVLQTIPVC